MEGDSPFDRRLRRMRRDRGAKSGETADYLVHAASGELLDRLELVKRDFRDVLVFGCARTAEALRTRGLTVTAADPGFRLAAAAAGVQCDEDRLPFRNGSFDLAISIGTLDSVNDLPGALSLVRRALRPDGLFLAAFAGGGCLPRLRSAMLAADEAETGAASPRIHPQIDIRAAGDLLGRAGFALPVVDTHAYSVRFSSLRALISDLRAMGATNILSARARRPILRQGLAAATLDFASHAEADGKTTETFEIVYATAWAPAPDQPKPAPRGSGTRSLAAVLKPRAG